MELYPLHVFLTVATEKSFSRAAEKLFRTQPAVSLALQRLENDLGEKLIDRPEKDLPPPPPTSPPNSKTPSPSCATTPPDASSSAPTNQPLSISSSTSSATAASI